MRTTSLISRIVGPVLLVRALSILIDREHFVEMLGGLEREVDTVAFSFFPIALMMGCIAVALLHSDTSSLAGVLIRIMAWLGMAKASALMLFPDLVAAKVQVLARADFLSGILLMCVAVGGYFTWFGYVASRHVASTG